MTQFSRKLLVNMRLKCLGTKRRVDVLLGILILFVSFQGLLGISIRPTRSFTRCETITGMDTLKMMRTGTISMPHTVTIAMVQPLAEDMKSTLQTTQDTIITLPFIVAAIRIQVLIPIVTVICGLEAGTSAQMS